MIHIVMVETAENRWSESKAEFRNPCGMVT